MIGPSKLPALAILLMLQASTAGIAGDAAPRPDNSIVPNAENTRVLVRAPLQHFGEGLKGIARVVGEPVSTSSKNIPNKHEPSNIDRINTISYDGLVIRTYELSNGEKEMLLSVRMTKNRPGILPMLVGVNEKTIRAKYGDPRYVKENVYTYILEDPNETGQDSVNVEFTNSVVVGVEWRYYVD